MRQARKVGDVLETPEIVSSTKKVLSRTVR